MRRFCPDVRTFLQFASVCSGLASAWLVAVGSFGVTARVVAEGATTKWDYNLDVAKAMADQAGSGQAGVLLLIVSVALQLPTLGERQHPLPHSASKWAGVLFGVFLAGVLYLAATLWAERTEERLYKGAVQIFEARTTAQ